MTGSSFPAGGRLYTAEASALREELCRRLNATQGVALLISSDDADREAVSPATDFDHETPVAIGCVAKVLTAMLAASAVKDGAVAWTDSASQHLMEEADSPLFEHLSRVSLHQLLTHSHGLDVTHIRRVTFTDDGLVGVRPILFSASSAHVIAQPGQVVNYGSLGPWLMAAILERKYSMPYRTLLDEKLLRPLGIVITNPAGNGHTCPATGTGLQLSARALSRVARKFFHGTSLPGTPYGDLYGHHSVALPPQPYLGPRMCLGLIDFGSGWIGQAGRSNSGSVVLRIHPERRMSLVITANQNALSNTVMAGLFGQDMPDLRAHRPPRQLLPAQVKLIEVEKYCGTYRNGRFILKISTGEGGHAIAEVFDAPVGMAEAPTQPLRTTTIRPAADNCFLTTQTDSTMFGLIHFHGAGPDDAPLFARTPNLVFARTTN